MFARSPLYKYTQSDQKDAIESSNTRPAAVTRPLRNYTADKRGGTPPRSTPPRVWRLSNRVVTASVTPAEIGRREYGVSVPGAGAPGY